MNENDAQAEISSLNREINELKREIEQLKMFYDIPDIDTAISLKYLSRLFCEYSTEADRYFHLMPIKIDIFGAHRGDLNFSLNSLLVGV